jgi:hypothetical protein
MFEVRVQKSMIEFLVIGQDKKALAVVIQAANGIYVFGNGEKILKILFSFHPCKLRKNAERFVYGKIILHRKIKKAFLLSCFYQ